MDSWKSTLIESNRSGLLSEDGLEKELARIETEIGALLDLDRKDGRG